MKPYTLLAKPQEEIKYLQTMKLFKIYYKYTNARRHDTRHGRAEHTARTHTHTHKQKRYRLAAVPEKKGKKKHQR